MTHKTRTVTLYGTLTGQGWMLGDDADYQIQQPIVADLIAEAGRDVSGSGLVVAVKGAIDERSGDFRSARLAADGFVLIEHRRQGPPDGTVRSWARRVEIVDLPSLAYYVDAETYAWEDD